MRFHAFISYSHEADRGLAPVLQSALEKFAKPFYRPSGLKICRDSTDLGATPRLWTSIESSLADSQYFILLASAQAARSPWVNRELATWLDLKGGSIQRLLIVLTGGEIVWDRQRGDFDASQTTALPATLLGRFSEEPKYEDARGLGDPGKLKIANVEFQDIVASLAAEIRGTSKRALIGEEIRQQRRQRRFLTSVVIVLAALTIFAFYQRNLAIDAEGRAREANEDLTATNTTLDATNLKLETTNTRLNVANTTLNSRNEELKDANLRLNRALTAEQAARRLAQQRQLAAQAELVLNQQPALLPQSVLLATQAIRDGRESASLEPYQTLQRGVSLLPQELRKLVFRDPPNNLSVSADGRRLAIATARLVEIRDSQSLRRLASQPLPFPIADVQISADGKRLAVSGGGTLIVWDMSGAKGELRELKSYGVHPEQRIAFSPSGKYVASTSLGAAFRMFALDDERFRFERSHGSIRAVGFSADERFVISGGSTSVQFWPVAGGTPTVCRIPDADLVAVGRDGTHLAAALRSGVIQVWRIDLQAKPAGREPCVEPRQVTHQGRLTALSLSDAGRYVAASGEDGTARLWDVTRGQEIARAVHAGAVTDVVLAPEVGSFWTSSADGTVRLWQRGIGRETLAHQAPVRTVAFTADGTFVTSGENSAGRVWTLVPSGLNEKAGSFQIAPLGVGEDSLYFQASAKSPDGRVVAVLTGSTLGITAHVWGADGKSAEIEFDDDLTDVPVIAVANAGRYVAVAQGDHKLTVRSADPGAGTPLTLTTWSPVTALAFDPGTKSLAAGDADGTLYVWSLSEGRLRAKQNVGARTGAMLFTEDGRHIVAALNPGGIVFLTSAGGARVRAIRAPGEIRSIALSPDDRYLASGDARGVVRVWNIASARQVAELRHSDAILSLAFSHDGRRLAAGAADHFAVVWFWTPRDLVREACSRLAPAFKAAPEYRSACGRLKW